MDPPLPPVDWGNVVLGWENVHYIQYRTEQISDFHPAVHAEWEHSDRPRSGLRTVKAQSGHRSEINSARRSRSASHSSVYARDVPLAKNPSTGTAQQRLFLVLKVVLHAVVVISKVLRLSTKSRCSRCCRHISSLRPVQHHGIRLRDHPHWRGYRCPV